MNYIRQLKSDCSAIERELAALKQGLNDLRHYLHSDKFRCGHSLDSYVNIGDVLAYLRNAEDAGLAAREKVDLVETN